MDWVETNGGPLICLERRSLAVWGGIDRLTIPAAGAETDYDRAGTVSYMAYTGVVPLKQGEALILGDAPLSTTIFLSTTKRILIARAIYASGDEDRILMVNRDVPFDECCEVLEINWQSSPIVMFDSAYPGDDQDLRMLSFEVEPGRHRVSTRTWEPDPESAFILHAVERI